LTVAFGIPDIASADLRIRDIPDISAGYREIHEFALKFDGYEWANGLDRLAPLANRVRNLYMEERRLEDGLTLDELRGCLFFEQRRDRWNDEFGEPGDLQVRYLRSLVAEIAERVRGR
jgi:hypothetical protein